MFPGLIQTFRAKPVLASLAVPATCMLCALALIYALAMESAVKVLYRHGREDD